ncbi:MAG TPA: HEAT repeat domain-containing protein [Gemmatimonadales bacterium]|nr:HEAT repeat domain-containing protein [Gemmatimonadales bacterium]
MRSTTWISMGVVVGGLWVGRGRPLQASRFVQGAERAVPAVAAAVATPVRRVEFPGDPADSLYKAARSLVNRGSYTQAARTFADLIKRYPKSAYVPDSFYWQAFSLYKTGDASNLKRARTLLDYQKTHYPKAASAGDGRALYGQVQGQLAQQGDQDAIIWVSQNAKIAADSTRPAAGSQSCANGDDDDDPRMAALNALLQMDADRAVPILKKVLARRDACSAALRRKAVFILAQQHAAGTEDILLDVARNDPDSDVRQQAVFWLSQVGGDRAVSALDSILRTATDPELQEKAIFALSQIDSPAAVKILRDYAERASGSVESRGKAIFWLGQKDTPENAAYLRGLYAKLTDEDLKEKTIFSLAQMGGDENLKWLMDLAVNEREPIEMRKKALFWAGQSGAALDQLVGLYAKTTNNDMKEQLIFVYSQRDEAGALDKLIDIAKHETDKELRKKAIFWIGQSHDPKAAQYLQEIIDQ